MTQGKSTRRASLAVLVTVALVAAACAENDDGTGTGTTADSAPLTEATEPSVETTEETETTTDATDATDDAEATDGTEAESTGASPELEWALEFTGGPGGEATGEPIVIGTAGTDDFFPNPPIAEELIVEYINTQLGGVDGRPIEVVRCNMSTPDAGATCGAEFANNDDIAAVVWGSIQGNADFIAALDGVKPMFTVTPLDAGDYVTPASPTYLTGALGAGAGLGLFALGLEPATAAAVTTDDAAGRGGFSILEPILAAGGVELVPVFVAPTATAPEIESALQAVGATDVDVLIIGLFEPGCIAANDALRNLGIDGSTGDVSILTTSVCYAPSVSDALVASGAEYPYGNGWYYSYYGYSPFLPNIESGYATLNGILEDAGRADLIGDSGVDGQMSAMLSITRILTEAAGDYSVDNVNGLLRSFEGPAPIGAGTLNCDVSPVFQAICASKVGIHQFRDGEWFAIAAGDDAIDITPVLNPES